MISRFGSNFLADFSEIVQTSLFISSIVLKDFSILDERAIGNNSEPVWIWDHYDFDNAVYFFRSRIGVLHRVRAISVLLTVVWLIVNE